MDTYKVNIDEDSFSIPASELDALDVVETSSKSYHVLKKHQSYIVEIEEADFLNKQLSIKVNGNLYEVQLEDKIDQLVNELGFSAAASQKMKFIKAPMPGLILEVLVEPGQEIQAGDPLIILEAMKMENILKADGEGIVKQIETQTSDAVEKGQVLIEME